MEAKIKKTTQHSKVTNFPKNDKEKTLLTVEEIDKLLKDADNPEMDVKLEDDYRKSLELIRQTQIENGVEPIEIKDYNEAIQERIDKMFDDDFNKIIDNLIDNSDVPADQRPKVKMELLNRMKKEKAITDEFEANKELFADEMKKLQMELDNLFSNMKYSELLAKLQELIDASVRDQNERSRLYYVNLYNEVDSIIHLTVMKTSIKRIKNPASIFERYNTEDYDIQYKRFFEKLRDSREYRFVDPSRLLEQLERYLPEDEKPNAKIFLYSLFRFINAKGKKGVNDYAVFLEGVFRIIYCLNGEKLEQKEKDDFINSMNSYLMIMKNS